MPDLFREEEVYLDNASTSYPKPQEVHDVLAHFYDTPIGSYGRSVDRHTRDGSVRIEELRDLLAQKLGANGMGAHIIFTQNATDGINRVLLGLPPLSEDEVVISPMEHNAVTRPLFLKLNGATPRVMPHHQDGVIDTSLLPDFLSNGCAPRLAIINAMSNVNGVTQPLDSIIRQIRKAIPSCLILVDMSQGFPSMSPFSGESLPDFIALTGHKGSLGPTGTGALFVREPATLTPILRGGNGFRSQEQQEIPFMPDRYEAGTLNLLGLTAWHAALTTATQPLINHTEWLEHIEQVKAIPGITLYSATTSHRQGSVYSITSERYSPAQLGDLLYSRYHIITRSGIHCAPLAHRTLGTLPKGTTRISISALTPPTYLQILYDALSELHS